MGIFAAIDLVFLAGGRYHTRTQRKKRRYTEEVEEESKKAEGRTEWGVHGCFHALFLSDHDVVCVVGGVLLDYLQ